MKEGKIRKQVTYVHVLPGSDGELSQPLDDLLLPRLVHHLRLALVVSLAKPYVLLLGQWRGSTEHLLQIFIGG